jgi:hypothetical protein
MLLLLLTLADASAAILLLISVPSTWRFLSGFGPCNDFTLTQTGTLIPINI